MKERTEQEALAFCAARGISQHFSPKGEFWCGRRGPHWKAEAGGFRAEGKTAAEALKNVQQRVAIEVELLQKLLA